MILKSEMKNPSYSTVHYQEYLHLNQLLNCQELRSETPGANAAHEEMLFIIVHQVYELWFKQILHELASIIDLFNKELVDERSIGIAESRLSRIVEIQKLLIEQIRVMETMTPLDFLDFRKVLFPASGFQSFQFRLLETLLGLKNRMTYHGQSYKSAFAKDLQDKLEEAEKKGSLFQIVEKWLERTPFLRFSDFDFITYYQEAIDNMMKKEEDSIKSSPALNEDQKKHRLTILKNTGDHYQVILDPQVHSKMFEAGEIRLSYRAILAALLIHLYRDEPILRGPFQLLVRLVEIDEYMTTWRYRHAQMVLRMLGRKMGTGGSSGHQYLVGTAEKHQIFRDLHNISTLLIPRSELPPLPHTLVKELGFYFTSN
jgi:tryptophan 2,3-dioxygenase